jgi:hypothetical protein
MRMATRETRCCEKKRGQRLEPFIAKQPEHRRDGVVDRGEHRSTVLGRDARGRGERFQVCCPMPIGIEGCDVEIIHCPDSGDRFFASEKIHPPRHMGIERCDVVGAPPADKQHPFADQADGTGNMIADAVIAHGMPCRSSS